jgi:uncharacterized Zn-finger protein
MKKKVVQFDEITKVGNLICRSCGRLFVSVRHPSTPLKDLECPYCGPGYMYQPENICRRK